MSDRLKGILGDRGDVYPAGDEPSLAAALATIFASGGPDVLAINGGDGTVHVVLTAVLNLLGDRPLPLIQVLPGGTMNTVSGSYGVRGRMLGIFGHGPEAWLRALLAHETAAAVPSVLRNVLRVEGSAVPQYGFLFGNGLISNFLDVYYEGSEPTPGKALVILGRGILSGFVNGAAIRRLMQPARCRVEADDGPWPESEYLAVGAGTVDDIGFGFRAFFQSVANPGRMHALGISCSAVRFIFQLPRVWLARPMTDPGVVQRLATALRLTGDADLVYMIDGDFHRAGRELRVVVGPQLRLGTPKIGGPG